MPDVIGIDHIYITVSDLDASERFYDKLMNILGFRKLRFQIGDEDHIHYYNRHFGYVLRPAHSKNTHNPYAPGLHHLCLRVEDEEAVADAAAQLQAIDIFATEPATYPEYAPDYFATFFTDPDGIRLEITNYRQERRKRHDDWDLLDI